MPNEAPNENVRSLLWANNRRDRAALPKERQTLSIMCVLARTKWWTVGAAVRLASRPRFVTCGNPLRRFVRRPFCAVSVTHPRVAVPLSLAGSLGRAQARLGMHYEGENYSVLTRQRSGSTAESRSSARGRPDRDSRSEKPARGAARMKIDA